MDEDANVPWVIENGLDIRRQARRRFAMAVVMADELGSDAENDARSALHLAASAFNWLEDTEWESTAHEEMDKYGRYTRQNFPGGCEVVWTGSSYEHRCPVRIAHKRIGLSVGFTAKRHCSVCDEDLSECPHTPGERCEVEGGVDKYGVCRVCHADSCRRHLPGQIYTTRVGSIIRQAEMHEVSFVARPKQPDARLAALPVDTARLQESLGPRFRPGMRVSCDFCLLECRGVDRPFEGSGHG